MTLLALMPAVLCTGWLAVTNEVSNDVVLIDEAGLDVVARIPVGKRPRGLKVSRDGRQLLVAVSGSPRGGPGVEDAKLPPPDRKADGIAIIDLVERKVVRTVASGPDPETFDVSADGKELYVANEDASTASIVEVRSGRVVAEVKVGDEPEGVALHPKGHVVYVTSEQANEVSVIDVKRRREVSRVRTGARPRGIVFDSSGARAYVTNELGASVTFIDAERHTRLRDVQLPGALCRPMGAVLSPDGATLWVTTGRGGAVVGIDTARGAITHQFDGVGPRPWGIAVSRDGSRLYTANGPSGDVTVIDVREGRLIGRVATGAGPWGLTVVEPPKRQLRVCADPNNLPFSDEAGGGFENRLAQLLAEELGAQVAYTWWPQRRAFLENTLEANRCDVVMGVPLGLERVRTTRAYYRSGWVLALGPKAPRLSGLDAPELSGLRIGVPLIGDDGAAPTPVLELGRRGLVSNLRGYRLQGDDSRDAQPTELLAAVVRGEVDVAIAWGPLAGWFGARSKPRLTLVELPETVEIGLGVRHADATLAGELDAALVHRRKDVEALLTSYAVPRW